ncbi:hypothetical protein BOO35_19525 [Vibrio navarrensis]|uniref:glycosyltransferase family 2 protein n=1 Tax=Vibrio navarrensis TaxID=29495 RepID=UPI0018679919|nr:glycosyltransferase family 2 protein [Vibrio navarrensis]MBE3667246.1 hypothetical protein [Vibrio navarrensis]
MKVFISVVSHGHGKLISSLDVLSKLNDNYKVVIKNNKSDPELFEYSKSNNITLLDFSYGAGFGENNNIVYQYCKSDLGMQDNDYFIVLNPDVVIEKIAIDLLISQQIENQDNLVAINLFKDKLYNIPDNSVRKFPRLWDFFSSLVFKINKTLIDKNVLMDRATVDWVAGSFMSFKSVHYKKLKGFNEKYFMYCEDIDICYRSKNKGSSVIFYKNIKAIHYAQQDSRNIFSKNFVWHTISSMRFLLSKVGIYSFSSSIK